ncbi:MAG TPA: DUF1801 domain-containing protein [Chitinophagaceae bacterium]|nr:DUF1801 domain-containing protein [Chitinophagaceae bacterium]MCC6635008.1 DUF1801 domain-containing protein [Chitinophagaceae bacterium]HMZ45303.1 DUF1801 domain-containing protein [Chitinophagaceae bacterium]HNE94152.1 DUF1801 domain-containing protein [Chitinophagaceae bacterium]HNF29321.1 DUF1801 domain-containing protein [Chitinophagaceae bacterium]
MSELKTKKNNASVIDFINLVEKEQKRKECFQLLELFETVTKEKASMWGSSIIGFGEYKYKYESGREGDWFFAGFSPRKQNIVIYIIAGFTDYESLMQQLGKYKTGSSCLYINKLADIDLKVLKLLIEKSFAFMKNKYAKN